MNTRRLLLCCQLTLLLSQLAGHNSHQANNSETAQGIVFADLNHNGTLDTNEPGIANVLVSNGSDVVTTNSQGRYQLTVSNDCALFVIKPPGWMVPVNQQQLPQYYYLHKPQGSPPSKFPGVAPTGPLPASVDFPLHKKDDEDHFAMLLFGDPQPYTQSQVDYFEQDIIEEILDRQQSDLHPMDFGMTMGDIVGDDLDLYPSITQAIARLGIPWWNVLGNHDINFDASTDQYSDETFERVFGPSTYAFRYGNVCFIVLDNVLYPTLDSGQGKGAYTGGLTSDDFHFVENLLTHIPSTDLVVFCQHIPLWSQAEFGRPQTFRSQDRQRLFGLFKNHPNSFSISAHTHTMRQHHFDQHDHWPHLTPHHHLNVGTASGGWWSGPLDARGLPTTPMRDGTPNGYASIHFAGSQYQVHWKAANYPAEQQMTLLCPQVMSATERYTMSFFVNFYLGFAEDTVRYRIDDGPWKKMRYTQSPDPSYVQSWLQQYQVSDLRPGRSLPQPAQCTHLWSAKMPNNLPPGSYTLQVEATDSWGNTHTTSQVFRRE